MVQNNCKKIFSRMRKSCEWFISDFYFECVCEKAMSIRLNKFVENWILYNLIVFCFVFAGSSCYRRVQYEVDKKYIHQHIHSSCIYFYIYIYMFRGCLLDGNTTTTSSPVYRPPPCLQPLAEMSSYTMHQCYPILL